MAWTTNLRRTTVLQDISSTPVALRAIDQENMVIPDSFLTPSPEEQIIRQRRRSMPCQQAPGKPQMSQIISILSDSWGSLETPTKLSGSGLGQCSRKRLLLPPTPESPSDQVHPGSPRSKRRRVQRRASCPPLTDELKSLSKDQLVDLLDKLVITHPMLEHDVRDWLPMADLKPLEDNLKYLQHNVYRSLPSNRWGSTRDAYCYRWVKTHLAAFKRACIQQGRLLVKSQCWDVVICYVLKAWRYVHQLPVWDNPAHNDARNKCFQTLAAHCMTALKNSSFEKEMYRSIHEKLCAATKINKEMDPCLQKIKKILAELE